MKLSECQKKKGKIITFQIINKKPQQDVEVKNVKVRDLIYKNPIHIFFKLTVYIGKGGQKTNFAFNSISYTYDNQLFMLGVKNNI